MCIAVKYGIWNVQSPEQSAVNALVGAGYSPLTAMVLAARGMSGVADAKAYLDCNATLPDPFAMKDMAEAESYLKGQTIDCDGENGWTLVLVDGYSLGWGKVSVRA